MLIQQGQVPFNSWGIPSPGLYESQSHGLVKPLLQRAMALAKVGAWSCNLADSSLSWTSAVYDLFGLSPNMLLDRRQTVEMYAEHSRDALERLRARAIAVGGTFTLDAQIT
ncbi:hypothetical protein IFT87_05045 [Sphingomonas sp. CFBP 8765]|nr:hypothetical protein [Sphingomonas sp. CFBP 8765]